MDLQDLILKIDENKAKIDEKRPIDELSIYRIYQYFSIGLTFSSNAIEGNSLTYDETKILLENGLTAGGKPIIHSLEAIGHSDAFDYMIEISRGKEFTLTEDIIFTLHKLFYNKIDFLHAGVIRDIDVFITGSDKSLPTFNEVPELLNKFIFDYNNIKDKGHVIQLASYAHLNLVEIHPFVDGNGRTARLLMNLIFLNKGYQIAIIPPVLRSEYINAIKKALKFNDIEPFCIFIANCELASQKEYLQLLKTR